MSQNLQCWVVNENDAIFEPQNLDYENCYNYRILLLLFISEKVNLLIQWLKYSPSLIILSTNNILFDAEKLADFQEKEKGRPKEQNHSTKVCIKSTLIFIIIINALFTK